MTGSLKTPPPRRMSSGYVFCATNPSMPGLVYMGVGDPESEVRRLSESDASPEPFTLEFAKKVTNPSQKLEGLSRILNPSHGRFFRCCPETVRLLVDLMDGEMWAGTGTGTEAGRDKYTKYRHLSLCPHGTRFRHTTAGSTWVGAYDSALKAIVYYRNCYESLTAFARAHCKFAGTAVANTDWGDCEFEEGGEWIKVRSALWGP